MARADALPASLPPRGLSRTAAAQYVGLGVTKFDELVASDRMPKPLRVDGRRIWDRRALDRAFEALGGDATVEKNEWDDVA